MKQNKEKFSLEWLEQEYARFSKAGKRLTDLVLGQKELDELRSWAFKPMKPTKTKSKSRIGQEIWGVQIHVIESPESYFRGYDLGDPKQEKKFNKENLKPPGNFDDSNYQEINTKK